MTQPNDTTAFRDFDAAIDDSAGVAAIVAVTAQQAVLPRKLEEGVYATLDADGAVQIVETDGYAQQRKHDWAMARAHVPERIVRSSTVLDVDSFIDFLARRTAVAGTAVAADGDKVGADYLLGDGSLEVWADLDARSVTGILDGIDARREHSVTLKLALSREWAEWAAIDGRMLSQVQMAEFIEDHLSTIAQPAGAVLLDVCQTLQAHTNVAFKQQAILASGQRQFRWEETVEAKAGQKGDLTIPGELTLVLRPFQGGTPVPVLARFRFAVRGGELSLGVKLSEPDKALEDAFSAVVADVQQAVPVHICLGRP